MQLRELIILKRNGPAHAVRPRQAGALAGHRPAQAPGASPDQIEQLVSRIVRQLESLGETEIPSSTVGDLIMKALKALDEVAYVRYASVYQDFRQTGDFARFLGDEGLSEPDKDR